ncbi:(2Fe-2S)-binding protein [Streptomyces sp. NRRL S-1813]|uniref:(2Fe-2S)-binding protein n=1 Tax=Streptomyces sp. NRRL S-1813 TaxID=1463888 RepID=UPI0004C4A622|nr:(2Fe-2S)-binding protein [Streptomyces sp. NRRL S-1813]
MTEPTTELQEQVSALGPFFTFETHATGSELIAPWRKLSEVARAESGVLEERVASVRAALAAGGGRPAEAVELRVAASVAHLGLMARVVSPLLGLAALHRLPSRPPMLDDLRWHSGLGGAFALSLPRETVAAVATGDAGSVAGAGAAGALLEGPVRDLVDAGAAFSVSRRILWGNVASAVNGAAAGIVSAAPALARPARTAALLMLRQPQLRDAHALDPRNGRFRRRSCCLIYRAAPDAAGAVCGDCVLVRR